MKAKPFRIVLAALLGAFSLAAGPDPNTSSAITGGLPWARFRGPNGCGLSDSDIPAQWTEKNYLWKTALPGGGNSSPILYKDRVFVLCGNGETGERMVVCVNAPDGSIRWTKTYPGHSYHLHDFNSYTSNSVAADDQHIYVCWSTPEELSMLALDHEGNEIWKRDLGTFVSQHGGGQSPMVFNNLVFVGDDQEGPESFLFALDARTGKIVWKMPRGHTDKFSASTPCVFQPKDGAAQVIFTSKAQGFTAVEPHTGRVLWELPKVFDARAVASPYVADGLIYGSCGDGPMGHEFAAAKPSEDGQSADTAFVLKKGVPYVPTSIVKNGLLFYITDNGVMRCLKPATGETIWTERLDGNFFGSLVCARDKIFVESKEGEVFVIAAADKFQLLGRNPLKFEDTTERRPPLSTTPAIADGKMYIRTFNHLACIK